MTPRRRNILDVRLYIGVSVVPNARISQPQVIQDIYRKYLEIGGSNIIGTNTCSYTTIAMADYDMQP
jgi:methionine synthase I (cobalamin-dependent)